MTLRPRYSLLTLLIFTALIANGVKWWRGPHHDVFDNPRTPWEEFHLYPVHDCIKAFGGEGVQFQFHLERLHGWEEDEILSLKLVPQQELTFCRYAKPGFADITVLLTPNLRRTWDAMAKEGVQLVSSERVICLLHGGRQITVVRVEQVPTPAIPAMLQNDPWNPVPPPATTMLNGIIEPNPLYFLTERGKIYELEMYQNCWEVLQPAKVEEMIDAGLRATTDIELERLDLPR